MTLLIYVENFMIIIVITYVIVIVIVKKNNECVCITGKYSEFCEKIVLF